MAGVDAICVDVSRKGNEMSARGAGEGYGTHSGLDLLDPARGAKGGCVGGR